MYFQRLYSLPNSLILENNGMDVCTPTHERIVLIIRFLILTFFCKTFSTCQRHFIKPENNYKVLCVSKGAHWCAQGYGLIRYWGSLATTGATSANASTKPIVSHRQADTLVCWPTPAQQSVETETAAQCWGSFLSLALLSPSLFYPLRKAVWVWHLFFHSWFSHRWKQCDETWLRVHSKGPGSVYSVNRNVHSKTLNPHLDCLVSYI